MSKKGAFQHPDWDGWAGKPEDRPTLEPTALPKPRWSGSFDLFGVTVRCHVLEDGRRIIEAESMAALLAAMESGAEPGDIQGFARWQRGLA